MSISRVVIVGAGQGGLQAAISLRQNGHDGPVTLIGAEPGLPYQRPPLSKAYLLEGKVSALTLRPESFFASKEVAYLPETTVEHIDREQQHVLTGSGQRIPYDHLVLATGTSNMRPPIKGLERTYDLRTMADADRLRERLTASQRIAVIGGGFIGLEFAAVARKLGHQVSVIEAAPRLMARAVSKPMSEYFATRHREWGSKLYLGQPANEVTDSGVTLADGTEVEASFVLLAAGVRPNTGLAEAAGLAVENGVRVNRQLQTSDPAISALGDCASFPDPRTGRHIRLESVQAATDHARLIAARIAKGDTADYAALPWFWSDQGDKKLQIAGFAGPKDHAEIVSETVTVRFDGDRLTAVETVNDARTHMKTRRLLGNPKPVTRADFEAIIAE